MTAISIILTKASRVCKKDCISSQSSLSGLLPVAVIDIRIPFSIQAGPELGGIVNVDDKGVPNAAYAQRVLEASSLGTECNLILLDLLEHVRFLSRKSEYVVCEECRL